MLGVFMMQAFAYVGHKHDDVIFHGVECMHRLDLVHALILKTWK